MAVAARECMPMHGGSALSFLSAATCPARFKGLKTLPQKGTSKGLWRNGSACDSRSQGWEFESLWPHAEL